ncbi:hypothetical protein HID58_015654, partial [Brassica napus]
LPNHWIAQLERYFGRTRCFAKIMILDCLPTHLSALHLDELVWLALKSETYSTKSVKEARAWQNAQELKSSLSLLITTSKSSQLIPLPT